MPRRVHGYSNLCLAGFLLEAGQAGHQAIFWQKTPPELKRQHGHDCRCQQAHVLAVLLRVEPVIKEAKQLLALTA
ncbi:hypothetical protein D3C79_1033250 [compost metagenome]